MDPTQPNNDVPTPDVPTETPAPEAPVTPGTETPVSETPAEASAPAPAPVAAPVAPAAVDPGHGLGIASLILSILGVGLVGIILGAVAMKKSRDAGHKNGIAIAGIIVGAVSVVIGLLVFLFVIVGAMGMAAACAEPGVVCS